MSEELADKDLLKPDPPGELECYQAEFCRYCGSRLNPAFYFCLVCATPYKTVDNVIMPVPARARSEAELIQEKAPNVWRVFWTYAIIVFAVGLISYVFFRADEDKIYSIILGDGLIILATLVFQITFWPSLRVQLKNFGFQSGWAWVSFLILPGLLAVNLIFSLAISHWFPEVHSQSDDFSASGLGPAGLFITLCLIPGITEEIAFRGLILHWLQTTIKPWRALLLSSALFAGLHVNPLGFPYLFVVGCLFGWARLKTRSLYPSMLLHILHNTVVLFLFPVLSS